MTNCNSLVRKLCTGIYEREVEFLHVSTRPCFNFNRKVYYFYFDRGVPVDGSVPAPSPSEKDAAERRRKWRPLIQDPRLSLSLLLSLAAAPDPPAREKKAPACCS